MKKFIKVTCSLICLAGWLLACNNDPASLPTTMPVASVPVDTPMLPSSTPDAGEPTPLPTATETPDAPDTTPTATADGSPEPGVTISDPSENMTLLLGSEAVVRGRAQLPSSSRLVVTLLSQTWYELVTAEAALGEVGWEASLTVPYEVGGNGRILAEILDEDDNILASDEISVWLEPDTDNMQRYLTLNRPFTDNVAVRGFNFLFDGTVFNPVNNTISISIWAEDCRIQVARQNFILGSSATAFNWHGFIIVPAEAEGEACAVAGFGQPDEPNWREIQVPIMVYPSSAAEARQLEIARPLPQTIYRAGDRLFIYGTAPGITEGVVLVSVLLENGRIIDENEVTTDLWGYWEFETLLPVDVEGPAEITVSAGEVDEAGYVTQQTLITILPGDTNATDSDNETDETEAGEEEP
jgi:hypothetical protein